MDVIGDLNLGGNTLYGVTIETVENFPISPKAGRFIFKDKRAMMCVEVTGGIPVWVPLTQELSMVIHNQTVAASSWVIEHELNTTNLIVQVLDVNNLTIIPESIDLSVLNEVTINFGAASLPGKAVIMSGTIDGHPKPNFAYTQDFTNTSTVVVTHGLGYNPIIRVFIGNYEVQPASIVHDSTTQATITFSSPQTGTVRCI